MIRAAVVADALEIAKVHVASWQVAYRGHVPDAYLDGLKAAEWARRWARNFEDGMRSIFVASVPQVRDEDYALVGFCSLVPSRDTDASGAVGEISALYVEPRHWRDQHGSALLRAAVAAARERGYGELTLWVLAQNVPARAFYEASGFVADGAAKTESRADFSLHEVRYRRQLTRGEEASRPA